MASFGSHVLQKGHMLLLLLAFSAWISALDVDVCSSFNTGETPLNVSIWQSNGLCTIFCTKKNYAFSVSHQNSCWCSNYYPDKTSTTEVTKCNLPCPGWTAEFCGGPGLYGYILLNEVAPSGTKTESTPSSTPTESTASTSASTASSSKTTSTSASASTSSSTSTSETSTTSTSSSSSTTDSSSSSSTTSSATNSPSTSSTGQTDPSQTDDPSGDHSGDQSGLSSAKSGLGTGAIVGIVIGLVGGLLVLGGAILFWFLRRKKLNKDEYRDDPSVRGSSSGMVGSVPQEMSANSGSPASPASAINRNSTIQIDPRMDPFKQGLYIRGSHESLNTIRDDHDYSRRIHPPVLRAMNPDPED